MQLKIFEFVDRVMETINKNSYIYDLGHQEVSTYFENLFADEDYFLNLSSRVKTPESVKEKILRQNLYIKYDSVQGLLDGLPDMIGVRIECRFIPDERLVYDKIVENFDIWIEDGYFKSKDNDNIVLKLDEPQPQVQKNGLDIYKIDGYYLNNDKKYNFELQIKSLVNNFWGDIEHKILYKNYSYLMAEDFVISMMNSINESLSLIDGQLRVVYDYVYSSERNSTGLYQIKNVLAKLIHDKYFQMSKDQLGFVVDFKPIVEMAVDFLFYNADDIGQDDFGLEVLRILENTSRADQTSQKLDETIDLNFDLDFESGYYKDLGDRILVLINEDFRWNLLFKILFELTDKGKKQVLEDFVVYLVDKFYTIARGALEGTRFSDRDKDKVEEMILMTFVNYFGSLPSLESYKQEIFDELEFTLNYYLKDLSSYESFLIYQDDLERIIRDTIS